MTEIRRAYEKRAAAWKAYIDGVTLTDEGMRADVLTAFEAGYDAAIRDFDPPYPEVRRALDEIDAERKTRMPTATTMQVVVSNPCEMRRAGIPHSYGVHCAECGV
jgi:hypothetical protein